MTQVKFSATDGLWVQVEKLDKCMCCNVNLLGLGEWILKGVLLDSRGGVQGTEKKKKKKIIWFGGR